jgi:hypothetical protein
VRRSLLNDPTNFRFGTPEGPLGGNNERDFVFLLFPGSGNGSILPTATAPTAANAGALINLPKLNNDSDAATQLVLFLALDGNLGKYNQSSLAACLRTRWLRQR